MRSYAGRGVGAHFANDLFLAKNYVYVVSRWISPEYAEKLINMAREGVEVKVLTSDDKEKNHQESLKMLTSALKPPKLAFLKKWEPINMELGVIREEYLHVKLYVWDDSGAAVGSVNLTRNGLWNNIEHVVVFDRPEEIDMIKRDFEALWKLYTEEKEVSREVFTLADLASKLGKSLGELKGLFKKK